MPGDIKGNRGGIKFAEATVGDLPDIMSVELASFSSPWTVGMFVDELEREFSHILLARDGTGLILGFIIFWVLIDELHILNLAVRPDARRGGVGKALVVRALQTARERGAESATLEVRQKNEAAVSLYRSMGFVDTGLRKGYYESPRDNAVIMWLHDIGRALKKRP